MTVDDPPGWVDRDVVTVEPERTYVLVSASDDVERRIYLTGVGEERAYGVDCGPPGERVTLTDVRELVANGRLVPADAYEEARG